MPILRQSRPSNLSRNEGLGGLGVAWPRVERTTDLLLKVVLQSGFYGQIFRVSLKIQRSLNSKPVDPQTYEVNTPKINQKYRMVGKEMATIPVTIIGQPTSSRIIGR